jgi:hypothetical protein
VVGAGVVEEVVEGFDVGVVGAGVVEVVEDGVDKNRGGGD